MKIGRQKLDEILSGFEDKKQTRLSHHFAAFAHPKFSED